MKCVGTGSFDTSPAGRAKAYSMSRVRAMTLEVFTWYLESESQYTPNRSIRMSFVNTPLCWTGFAEPSASSEVFSLFGDTMMLWRHTPPQNGCFGSELWSS